MKYITTIIAVCLAFLCFGTPALAVKKIFVPNGSVLQPLPVNVIPNVSGNVNNVSHNTNPISPIFNQQTIDSSGIFSPTIYNPKNGTVSINYFLFSAIFIIVLAICLFIFWWLRKRRAQE